jgi:hypothetical protein
MTVKGLELCEIESLADSMGVKVTNVREKGKGIAFVIRPTERMSDEYRVTGHNGRKVHAVNASGHYYLFALLLGYGATEIKTSLETYSSLKGLEEKGKKVIERGGWQGKSFA